MKVDLDSMIVLTTGKQDRGTRATLAFSWGCAALAMGRTVAIYLTMDGTIWASRGSAEGVEVGGFEPLPDYIEQFVALGGEILACAPCSQYYCSFERDRIPSCLLESVQLVGLATIVNRIGATTKVITF
jgi:predicted peroxiredoxin